MIGDHISITEEQLSLSREVYQAFISQCSDLDSIKVLSIAGESGSGKSTLSIGIKEAFSELDKGKCIVLHMDDYFILPPQDNHNARVKNIKHLGPTEVDLALINKHLEIIFSGADTLQKPLVDHGNNTIISEQLDLRDCKLVIVEGTYISLLDGIDYKIFIDRTYQDTLIDRVKRARDPITPFIESVLEIEHQIISSHKKYADLIITTDFKIQTT